MSTYWGYDVPGVSVIPVFVSGQWTKLDKQQRWDPLFVWKGYARAEEPLVALTLRGDPTTLYWVKSVKYHLVEGEIKEIAVLPVSLSFHDDSNTLNFSVGFRGLGSRVNKIEETLPIMRSLSTDFVTQTGRLVEFVRLPDYPETSFGVLFLARRDVKYARKCIWNIRKELLGPDLLKEQLTSTRAGRIWLNELVG